MKSYIPKNYKPSLSLYDTQTAISFIKKDFIDKLSEFLNLKRVSAPLFVECGTGINDDLDGIARAVDFDIPCIGKSGTVVHSLAKWKRMALYRYDFHTGKGLYTDMNAIRRDEELDNLHSVYVDQWDWEKVITRENRNLDYLYNTVRLIHSCIYATLTDLKIKYPTINVELEKELHFISSEELVQLYPDKTPKEREYEICRKYGSVFVTGIGHDLSDGKPHDIRASDYDDWNLNGDLLYYNSVLDIPFEVSSMGIRVDARSLEEQLKLKNEEYKKDFEYHRMILNDELPLTIGGGIGQSRLAMLLMGKAHIGEVQSSLWEEDLYKLALEKGVVIL